MPHQVLEPVRPEVSPVAGRIGAVVTRVRLSGDLPERVVAELGRALLRHRVLFFRDQHHLDAAGQARFARRLGEPAACCGDGRADAWHTDGTFAERPPKAMLMRAIEVPRHGGDTVWANTAAAYEDLPAELRELADRLWVLHGHGDARAEHPLVRVHPETGERAILLGGFARSIVGLSSRADSGALIRLFQEHVTRLENTVRWRWAPGDVAVCDNRATQHRVVQDFGGRPRLLWRVAVGGDVPVPVPVDGRSGAARPPAAGG
ncbi:TauD/TfdA dioxygenase family protein [Actinomadura xylanilytica]|uniref:TauD/TfdA dioxygenase family protein n=1 Tax=Actinomadura xylanilytica TaxID=887459 RepID=UPI00255B3AC7|nr:TauD/TfdA family dioxygenase [Actinomadura xylanilytica]MDL4771377.1 TauD/TfdA family dioxygenase [Actinomadura xylanilytica]